MNTCLFGARSPQPLGVVVAVAVLALVASGPAAAPALGQTDDTAPPLPDSLRALSSDAIREQLAARAQEPPLRLALGERLIGEGELEEAIEQYRQYVLMNPDYLPALRRLAQLYDWTTQPERAAVMYERVLELDPDDVDAREALAQRYAWTERPREAAAALRDVLERRPGDLAARRRLAELYVWGGQNDLAIEQYRSIARRDPADYTSKRELARLLAAENEPVEAVAIYRNLADVWPDSLDVRVRLAQTLAWNDEQEAALREVNRILRRDPDHDEALLLAAEIERWDGQWQQSQRRLSVVRSRAPGNERARELLRGLRYDYGPRFEARYRRRHDSNDLTTDYLPLAFSAHAGQRWRLGLTVFQRRIYDGRLDEVDALIVSPFDPDDYDESLQGYGGSVFAERSFTTGTTARAEAGVTAYGGGDFVAPSLQLSLEQAFSERVVFTTTYAYDFTNEGVIPLVEDIATHSLTASLYTRPLDRLEVGLQARPTYYTDENARLSFYAGGNYVMRMEDPELRLLASFGYDDTVEFYPTSLPYFTPSNLSTYSGGVRVRQRVLDWLVLGGTYRLTLQSQFEPDDPDLVLGEEFDDVNLANNFGLYLGIDQLGFHRAYVQFNQTGSAVYSSTELLVGYSYRF